jgi:hypothetical protein
VNTGAKPLNSVPRSGKLPSSPSQDREISSTSLATAGDRARHVAIAPYLPASTFQTLSPTARSRPICQSTAIRASPPIRLPLVVSLVWWCPRIGNHHWFSCAPICRSTRPTYAWLARRQAHRRVSWSRYRSTRYRADPAEAELQSTRRCADIRGWKW